MVKSSSRSAINLSPIPIDPDPDIAWRMQHNVEFSMQRRSGAILRVKPPRRVSLCMVCSATLYG
jgi:hypothetical protein